MFACVFFLPPSQKFLLKKHPSINVTARYRGRKIVIATKGLNNGTLTSQK
jgi:hypothetical protein